MDPRPVATLATLFTDAALEPAPLPPVSLALPATP